MRTRLTTRCCVLTAMLGLGFSAAPSAAATSSGVALFPLTIAWSAQLPAPPSAAAAYDDERAYVPLRSGQLVAAALHDGAPAWAAEVSTTLRPAVGDGLVFVAADDTMIALRVTDGATVWASPLGSPITAPPAWDTGWLVAALDTGEVVALRAADGAVLWRQTLEPGLQLPASLAGATLFVPLPDGVAALDLYSGAVLWRKSLAGRATVILPLEERLFVGSTDNFFYCLDTRDGRFRWRWRTGADVIGAPVVDTSRVYFVSLDNVLRALDRRNGVLRWKRALPTRPIDGPTLAGSTLVLSGLAPVITGYSSDTGAPAGRITMPADLAAPAGVIGPVTLDAARLLAVTGDSGVYLLRRATGPALEPLTIVPGRPVGGLVPGLPQPIPGEPLRPESPPQVERTAAGARSPVDQAVRASSVAWTPSALSIDSELR